jgi:3-oxoacyl-[acyl-carrier protein] reductase
VSEPLRLPGLDGRVAIVTGANHGIGAATALELARNGACVLISYFRMLPGEPDPERPDAYDRDRGADASAVVTAIREAGGKADSVEADLTDPSAAPAIFDAAEAAFGPVDVLVHNASAWSKDTFGPSGRDELDRPTDEVTARSVHGQFMVDARAGGLLIMELARRHRARGATSGRIVTMTSGGRDGFPGEVSYGAAKAALVSFSLSAASELAADGISVNVVHPAVTDTGWIDDRVRAFVATDPRFHHIAAPEEVAETIAWLCADANHLVTGNVLQLR